VAFIEQVVCISLKAHAPSSPVTTDVVLPRGQVDKERFYALTNGI
jgi:hypothetical protein